MDLTNIYSKCFGKKFRKLKKIAVIAFIAGCFINPFLNDLAFFIAGASVGCFGLLMGFEKAAKDSLFLASKTEEKNNKIYFSMHDKGFDVVVDKNSVALQRNEIEGEGEVLVLTPGVVIGKLNLIESFEQESTEAQGKP